MLHACGLGSGMGSGSIYWSDPPEGHVLDVGDVRDFWSLSALGKSFPIHVCVHKKRQVEINLRECICLVQSRCTSCSGLEQQDDGISEKFHSVPSAPLPHRMYCTRV